MSFRSRSRSRSRLTTYTTALSSRAQTRAGTLSVEIEMLTNAASALSRQTAAFLVPCTLVRVACAAARSKSDRCLHGRHRRGS